MESDVDRMRFILCLLDAPIERPEEVTLSWIVTRVYC